ncbi:hypothetical protein LFL96_36520 (plasmid) [Paraburkholderia sp. D15]|uniref:hypothetical protein n=1 Tax=Paraburkholderia sp. D15 TaxID=2880218 RepID=UPI00247A1FF2|nr:hypothetical protein [Paraburkholderia sp. D15]WGS54988.1 hypothetical protein LFL96_36520 [Paraburkholderia sp. D15]
MNDNAGNQPNDHAGKSHDEKVAAEKHTRQKAQEQPGGRMAEKGTESDSTHSSGTLSEEGRKVWRTGAGIDGGGKSK